VANDQAEKAEKKGADDKKEVADDKKEEADDKKREEADAREEKRKAALTAARFNAALNRQIEFAGNDDPNLSIVEALNDLSSRYDLQFDLNEAAFAEEEAREDAEPVVGKVLVGQLPSMRTSLRKVLTKLLSRLPGQSGATFLIRKDHIEITTENAVRRDLGLAPRKHDQFFRNLEPMTQLVWQEFHKESLADALRHLADDLDVNVVIDARVQEKTDVKVTAALHNVSLPTALKILTDAAGLVVVKIENVYYVTSRENAAKMEK